MKCRRILPTFFAPALALFLAACGDDGSSSASGGGESNTAIEESSSSDAPQSSSVAESSYSDTSGIVSVTAFVTDTFEVFAFGALNIDIAADSFLTMFDYGDIVTVMLPGFDTLDVPVVASYGDVFPGEFFLYAAEGLGYVKLEARYGQMAEVIDLGRDAEFPVGVVIRFDSPPRTQTTQFE